MNEIAFVMKLKPGYEGEYKRRHDQIWPELSSALVLAGVRDYSIYLDRSTGTLFAVQKRTAKNSADALATQEIVKKWWRYMADIMETNEGDKKSFVKIFQFCQLTERFVFAADFSPVCKPLECVFHID